MKILFFQSLFLLFSFLLFVTGQQQITWPKDGAEMVLIPSGVFEMGDHLNDGDISERPVHRVELDSFYMDKHQVTVGQFRQFVNQSGYDYPAHLWSKVAEYSPADDYPMVRLDWDDASAYARWAGKRLPTEAEWEYACRGRLVSKRYPWGDNWDAARDYANYSGTGGKDKWDLCSPVGSFKPNGYGLYDMVGNVWEWCADWYDKDYYESSPASNPTGPNTGEIRVLRGGSWNNYKKTLRLTHRSYHAPSVRYSLSGFRTVSSVRTKQVGELIGDINEDGIVNIFDLVIAVGSFRKMGTDLVGDVNGDNLVNIFDLVIIAGSFGQLWVSPSTASEIMLTTQQKRDLALIVDQLLVNSQRSVTEEVALRWLQSVLTERLPTTTQLLANYPNPFNPDTWMPFELGQDTEVIIRIYDVKSQLIRQLELGMVTAGRYLTSGRSAYWNGETDKGKVATSGIYFYQLQAGNYIKTRKMVILK